MNPDDVIYPPTYRKSSLGILIVLLFLCLPLLLTAAFGGDRLTTADKIWYGAVPGSPAPGC